MSDTQAELHAFLDDPETFKRAAEGSMAKRQAVLDQAELDRLHKEVEYCVTMEYKAPQGEPAKSRIDRLMRMFTAYKDKAVEEVLDRLENKGLLLEHSLGATDSGRVRRITEAIEAERNKLKEK